MKETDEDSEEPGSGAGVCGHEKAEDGNEGGDEGGDDDALEVWGTGAGMDAVRDGESLDKPMVEERNGPGNECGAPKMICGRNRKRGIKECLVENPKRRRLDVMGDGLRK